MLYNKPYFTLLYLILVCFTGSNAKKAFVSVPVTDLVGQPMSRLYRSKQPAAMYSSIPLESIRATFECPRLHQALYNEIVEILEEEGEEVKIKVKNIFYVTHANKSKKKSIFWAQKKDLICFDDLKRKNLDTSSLPPPITLTKNYNSITTLKLPFYDKVTKQLFSAGTRFVISKDHQDKKNYTTFIFDKKEFLFKKTSIPKTLCLNRKSNNRKRRKEFVKVAKEWANLTDGFIPYVWGGCSFVKPCKQKKIVIKHKNGIPIFNRKNYNTIPLTGLDCTGLIARIAQICNIPFFFKNTTTIDLYLPQIKEISDVQEGDIIWYPGHVMIISDIANNRIIEARTNSYGCGKVQEIVLSKAFKDIKNFKQLLDNKKNKLYRLDMNGNIVKKIKKLKILKLISNE